MKPTNVVPQAVLKWECPHCHNMAPFVPLANYVGVPSGTLPGGRTRFIGAAFYRCQTCEHPLLLQYGGEAQDHNWGIGGIQSFPLPTQEADVDIPDPIRPIFQEALNCNSVKAWNAVGSMARRAIQEAVIQKGGEGIDLFNQIEDLKAKGKLTGSLLDFAHQVRILGRDGSHAEDKFIDLDATDAEDAIEFCGQLFDHLYVAPKRLERQKQKRPK